MADTQRSKAAKLVDADVLGLGAASQKTRKTPGAVVQNNMSRFGAASPQPGLTPKSIPFAKGGKAKSAGKMQKAAQVAGMLSALTQGAGAPAGPMGAAPSAAPAGPPMGAPPGMKRGGRKLAMKKGGHAKKPKEGSAAEERGESKKFEASEDEGAGMKRGGKCMKCGGRAHGGACKMRTGGHMAPRNKQGRVGFAMGGPAKQRRGVMTPAGLPTKPKRGSYDNLI